MMTVSSIVPLKYPERSPHSIHLCLSRMQVLFGLFLLLLKMDNNMRSYIPTYIASAKKSELLLIKEKPYDSE